MNAVADLMIYEQVFKDLGLPYNPDGWFSVAGFVHKFGTEYQYNMDDYTHIQLEDDKLFWAAKCYQNAFDLYQKYGHPIVSGFALDKWGVLIPHVWCLNDSNRVLDMTWHTQCNVGCPKKYIGIKIANPINHHLLPFVLCYSSPYEWVIRLYQFSHIIDGLTHDLPIKRIWYREHKMYRAEQEHIWSDYIIPKGQ